MVGLSIQVTKSVSLAQEIVRNSQVASDCTQIVFIHSNSARVARHFRDILTALTMEKALQMRLAPNCHLTFMVVVRHILFGGAIFQYL